MSGGRKNTLTPISIVTNGNMSSDITSTSLNIQYLDYVSIQAVISGTPNGTFDVQISHDNSNWTSVPLSGSSSVAAGVPSPIIFENIQALPAPYIRLVYVASSGSGTLNASLSARQA